MTPRASGGAGACRYCAGTGWRVEYVGSRFLGHEPAAHPVDVKCWSCGGTGLSPSPPSGAEPTEERCNYCGLLDWTRERYGAVTHKHACPHRRDPRCQSHPEGCPFGAEPTEPTREDSDER